MYRFIQLLLITVLCSLMVSQSLFAHNVHRESKNIIVVDDLEFRIHSVKKRESLFSIARSYDVPTTLITKFNKQITGSSLSSDDILLIPIVDKKKTDTSVAQFEKLEYALHYVRSKETLFLISRLYSIPSDVIVQHNPNIDFDILQTDNILILPLHFTVSQTPPGTVTSPKPVPSSLRQHTIAQGETLYSISKAYNVNIDSIKKYNPALSSGTLSIGTLLQIPPTVELQGTFNAMSIIKDCRPLSKDSTLNVMVIMPFDRKNEKELERTYKHLAFYDGVKLAAEEFAKQGYKINLSLASSDIINTLDRSTERLSKQHFIIGLLYEAEIRTLLPVLHQYNIPFISAMSVSNALLSQYPYYYQVITTNERLLYNNIKKTVQNNQSNKVIITKSGDKDDKIIEKRLLFELSIEDTIRIPHRENISDENLEMVLHTFKTGTTQQSVKLFSCNMQNTAKSVNYALLQILSANKPNTIIVTSDQEPFVTQILSTLKIFKNLYKIDVKVIGSAAWLKFTSLDLELLYNNKIEVATNQYIDYSSPAVQQMLQRYQTQYLIEPSPLGFKGYDIMYYFCSAYQMYGKALGYCINSSFRLPVLTSSFDMKQACPTCGFENRGALYLQYTEDIDILMSR